uniref:Uncharacterized protein n=2 Tax=Acidianus brierleyi TaxID=41673 RepID=A0A2U9IFS5_9CREN
MQFYIFKYNSSKVSLQIYFTSFKLYNELHWNLYNISSRNIYAYFTQGSYYEYIISSNGEYVLTIIYLGKNVPTSSEAFLLAYNELNLINGPAGI